MRSLIAKPLGEIENPIIFSFREGLTLCSTLSRRTGARKESRRHRALGAGPGK